MALQAEFSYLTGKDKFENGTADVTLSNMRGWDQPIVSHSSGGVRGWEALLRGPGDLYLHNPGNIFRIAEGTQRLVELETMSHPMAVYQIGTPVSLIQI